MVISRDRFLMTLKGSVTAFQTFKRHFKSTKQRANKDCVNYYLFCILISLLYLIGFICKEQVLKEVSPPPENIREGGSIMIITML